MKKKTLPPIKEKDKTCCSINSKSKQELIDRINNLEVDLSGRERQIEDFSRALQSKCDKIKEMDALLETNIQNNIGINIEFKEQRDINEALERTINNLNAIIGNMTRSGAYYIT